MAVSQTSSGTQEYGDGGAYEGEFLNGFLRGVVAFHIAVRIEPVFPLFNRLLAGSALIFFD